MTRRIITDYLQAGVVTTCSFFIVTETYHPTLLNRKMHRLRKETGNDNLFNALQHDSLTHADRFKLAIVRPSKFLLTLPHFFLLSLYVAVEYGVLYIMFSTFTFVFQRQYGFSSGIVGLSYVPTGIGMMLGAGAFGALTDRALKKKMAAGGTPTPEDRLPLSLTIPSGVFVAAGLFWYGWATETNVHWIVPMLGVAVFCIGLMGVMLLIQMYLVDSYVRYAASVIAALTVIRSFVGALLPLSGLSLYNAIGWGWGNSVLAFISLALAPIPVMFLYIGPKMRKRFPANF
jgi:MFS family permease